jgi:hypothetical protein
MFSWDSLLSNGYLGAEGAMLTAYAISPMIVNLYVAVDYTPFVSLEVAGAAFALSIINWTSTLTSSIKLPPRLHRPPHHPALPFRAFRLPKLQPLRPSPLATGAPRSCCLARGRRRRPREIVILKSTIVQALGSQNVRNLSRRNLECCCHDRKRDVVGNIVCALEIKFLYIVTCIVSRVT